MPLEETGPTKLYILAQGEQAPKSRAAFDTHKPSDHYRTSHGKANRRNKSSGEGGAHGNEPSEQVVR